MEKDAGKSVWHAVLGFCFSFYPLTLKIYPDYDFPSLHSPCSFPPHLPNLDPLHVCLSLENKQASKG